jgi:hypothetical protein
MSTFGDRFRHEKINEIRSHLLRAAQAMAEIDPEVDYP